MVKLPQVAAVVRARSAAGLSPLSFELETLGLVIAVTYGFLMGLPFSAFGETVVSAGLRGSWRCVAGCGALAECCAAPPNLDLPSAQRCPILGPTPIRHAGAAGPEQHPAAADLPLPAPPPGAHAAADGRVGCRGLGCAVGPAVCGAHLHAV